MRVTQLDIKQFMRVDSVHMKFDESGAISIGGENGSGKTSVETFIEMCFGGKDKCPQMPVKIGAKKAMGRITLDDKDTTVTIDVEVNQSGHFRAVVRQDGGLPIESPITMLRALVSKFTFNPFDLMELSGREQRRVMLDCLGVNFDDLEAKEEDIKEQRTIVGRDRNGRERQLDSLTLHYGVPEDEINMSDVATELQEAMTHNEKCKDFHDAVEEWEDQKADIEDEIATLKEKLQKAEQELEGTVKDLKEAILAAAKYKPIDVKPIQKKLDEADAINEKIRANKTREKLQEQYEADHAEYDRLGGELDKIELEKQERLNNAECPIEGLEFREDGVWYQGLPLAQDMESDQMIKCVQLAAAMNTKLRTICIDNGERMLPVKLKELDEWAQANDYQVIIFRATESSDGCEFFLQDGSVKE